MTSFAIVACSTCQGLLAVRIGQKTKICPYCGSRILVHRTRQVALADTASEASTILKKMKQKVAEERRS